MDTTTRANTLYKDVLRQFEPPALDAAIREEVEAFITRRKAEGDADLER